VVALSLADAVRKIGRPQGSPLHHPGSSACPRCGPVESCVNLTFTISF